MVSLRIAIIEILHGNLDQSFIEENIDYTTCHTTMEGSIAVCVPLILVIVGINTTLIIQKSRLLS